MADKSTPGYSPPTQGFLAMLPSSWVPYIELARLDKPHGIYMIYYPHIVGLAYASSISSSPVTLETMAKRIASLLAWTIFMRSAICAWNDNIDQDYDRKTSRCWHRPIARGAISTMQAHLFTAALIPLSLYPLRSLPVECSMVAAVTYTLLGIYPFGKRFTNFPQVILGLSLGTCVILAAHSVDVDALSSAYRLPSFCLVGAITLLVVFYDVMYARQDTAEDIKSGVKGMAVRFRNNIPALMVVLVCSITTLLTALGRLVGMKLGYFVLAVGGVFLGLLFIIAVIVMDQGTDRPRHYGWHYAMVILILIGGFWTEYYQTSLSA